MRWHSEMASGPSGRFRRRANRTPRVLRVAPLFFGDDGMWGGGERYALELARHTAQYAPTRLLTFGPRARRVDTEISRYACFRCVGDIADTTSIPCSETAASRAAGRRGNPRTPLPQHRDEYVRLRGTSHLEAGVRNRPQQLGTQLRSQAATGQMGRWTACCQRLRGGTLP